MRCEQFRRAVHGLAVWDRPEDELPVALREHAAGCGSCAAEWDRVRRLDRALAAMAHEDGEAPPSVEEALLAAFRAHQRQVIATPVVPAPRRASPAIAWTWLALAAAVVLAVALAATWRWHGTVSSQRDTIAAMHSPAPAGAEASGADDAADEAALAGFVPLPYAALPADEAVHIVQIDLPRAALYDFGAPVEADTLANDVVTADILVSDDGAPRAFRIVDAAATTAATPGFDSQAPDARSIRQ
jgi:hypothetical protein